MAERGRDSNLDSVSCNQITRHHFIGSPYSPYWIYSLLINKTVSTTTTTTATTITTTTATTTTLETTRQQQEQKQRVWQQQQREGRISTLPHVRWRRAVPASECARVRITRMRAYSPSTCWHHAYVHSPGERVCVGIMCMRTYSASACRHHAHAHSPGQCVRRVGITRMCTHPASACALESRACALTRRVRVGITRMRTHPESSCASRHHAHAHSPG